MAKLIRGQFSGTAVGRQLAWLSGLLDQAADGRDFSKMIRICRIAETITSDRQWTAVRTTVEAIGRTRPGFVAKIAGNGFV